MEKVNQKEQGKTYNYLKGKRLEAYIGRIPSKFKRIEYEASLTPKENRYGKYVAFITQITRTHFNGKLAEIEFKHDGFYFHLKLTPSEIEALQFIEV